MHRFFSSSIPQPGNTLTLGKDEAHHARKVLRLAPGETIGLLDGRGTRAAGVIDAWAGSEAIVRVTNVEKIAPAQPAIVLAVAIPKGPRAQDMVDQLSQLGVTRLVPLIAQRSVVEPGEGKLDRFERTAMESAKQCGRAWVMEVGKPVTLTDALAGDEKIKLIAAPPTTTNAAAKPAPHLALLAAPAAGSVLVLIGPEGGWTDEELQLADARGAARWALGPNVMRIETAAVAAAALLRYPV